MYTVLWSLKGKAFCKCTQLTHAFLYQDPTREFISSVVLASNYWAGIYHCNPEHDNLQSPKPIDLLSFRSQAAKRSLAWLHPEVATAAAIGESQTTLFTAISASAWEWAMVSRVLKTLPGAADPHWSEYRWGKFEILGFGVWASVEASVPTYKPRP